MADNKAAFGVFPQMRPRRSKQDPEAAKTFPIDVARGIVSGIGGQAAVLESLGRGATRAVRAPSGQRLESFLEGMGAPTVMPSAEDIERRLPFRSDTPTSRVGTNVGEFVGDLYMGPLSAYRAAFALPRTIKRAGQDFVGMAGQSVSPLTVYHGSPHKFEKFDASKIGSGEGAQAYGHGLYFAESPGVASSYQRKLSDSLNPLIDGAEMDVKNPAHIAAVIMHDNSKIYPGMPDQAIENALYTLRGAMVHPDNKDVWSAAAKIIERGEPLPKVQEYKGNLYTVDLPDEKIARMLDWDKPLSQQPEVIKALKGTDYEVGMSQKQAEKVADQRLRQEADEWAEMTGGDPVDFINNADWERYVDRVRKESGSVDSSITGKELHRMIMRDEGYRPELFDPENYQVGTSEALRGYGIPGIRYLDATSRDAGKGASNFVVFPGEEDALTILERKKEGGSVHISDNADAQMMDVMDKKMAGGGLLRKAFNAMMNKPKYTSKLNLPDGRAILHAVTEPELRNTEILTSGRSQMMLDPSVAPEALALSRHPTYSHVIPKVPGSAVSRTKYPIPAELEFPDVFEFAKQNYRPRDITRVYQTGTPRQIVDPQHIDEMKMYEELMREYTGKKKGGKVDKSENGLIKVQKKRKAKA